MSQADLSTQINAAIGAHGAWKVRLKAAINTGTCDVTPAVASCDDKCAFGGWLYGPTISQTTRTGVPYQVIRRLHAEFHQCAGQVLTHVTVSYTHLDVYKRQIQPCALPTRPSVAAAGPSRSIRHAPPAPPACPTCSKRWRAPSGVRASTPWRRGSTGA